MHAASSRVFAGLAQDSAGLARAVFARVSMGAAAVAAVCAAFAVAGCGSNRGEPTVPTVDNRPPIIEFIRINPQTAHVNERIQVTVRAIDPDRDGLAYSWSASRGDFPDGYRSNSVRWLSPSTRGTDTLRVEVTDGIHTVRGALPVTLVRVAPPASISFVSSPGSIRVRWSASPDEGMSDWRGYEVYRSLRTFLGVPDDSLPAYRVALVAGGPREYTDASVETGVRYYYRLTSLRAWDDQVERSGTSTETSAAPPLGELAFDLREFAFGAAGLDLSARSPVQRIDPMDSSIIPDRDLYLGTSDPMDGTGPLVLKSVSLLAGRNPDWSERRVLLQAIGTDWEVHAPFGQDWSESVELVIGMVYAVRTPEGNYAKLQVTSVSGSAPGTRAARARRAYQVIPDFPNF